MNLLQRTERLVKQNWKERKRITLAVIVSFLINGGVGYATEEARGDTVSTPSGESSQVDIKPKDGSSIKVSKDSTGTIVDINKPDSNRVSRNEYNTFNMERNSKVLFNNSVKEGKGEGQREENSNIGYRNVHGNKNFDSGTQSATLIITEITGGTGTKLAGNLEVRNDKDTDTADLIFANENGINVNGIKYFGVGSVMYINDRDLANKNFFDEQKKKLESNSLWNGLLLLSEGNSQGAMHKGKKDSSSHEKEWTIQDGKVTPFVSGRARI